MENLDKRFIFLSKLEENFGYNFTCRVFPQFHERKKIARCRYPIQRRLQLFIFFRSEKSKYTEYYSNNNISLPFQTVKINQFSLISTHFETNSGNQTIANYWKSGREEGEGSVPRSSLRRYAISFPPPPLGARGGPRKGSISGVGRNSHGSRN